MTSQENPLAAQKETKQTTVRVVPELLRKARFYLDEENRSVQEFLAECLTAYVQERDKANRLPSARHDTASVH